MNTIRRGLLLCLLLAATAGCDRVTKHLAVTTLAGSPSQSFLADTLRLDYHENPGGFLSAGAAWTPLAVHYLQGGNAAWRAAGLPLTAQDPRMAHEPIDAWLKPYERPDGVKQAMADYLAWETDLLPRIARDGCAKFEVMR